MLKKFSFGNRFSFFLKDLLFAFVLTAGLLLFLALLLYKFSLSEKTVSLCITGIYILVTFLCGFIAGKKEGSRKFLWGALAGGLYFVLLLLVSLFVNHGISLFHGGAPIKLILCVGSGMLGGMLS